MTRYAMVADVGLLSVRWWRLGNKATVITEY